MKKTPAFALVAALFLTAAIGVGRATAQTPEVLSNDSIVQMVAGKVPKDVILAKIHSTSNTFDITANGLVNLTKSKLDKGIINAMIEAKADTKEVLTNDAVVVMVTGNVAKDVILFKIHSTRSKFDLTAGGLVGLTQNKVPQDIVKAMLNVAASAPAPEPEPPPPPAPTRAGGASTGRGAAAPPATADKPVAGANESITFTATGTVSSVYDKVRNRLAKTSDTTIQKADPVLGQITALRVYTEGTIDHENRIIVKVTASAGNSTVKVSVFDKNRKSATPPVRWGVEKYDLDMTNTLVADLKNILQKK